MHRESGPLAAWRQALQDSGVDALAEVAGDFAVGLTLSDGSVFLAVDRFGARTLCFSASGGQLRFAERANEIATDRTPSAQSIFDYLYFHVIPAPQTIYAGVWRLPAGHCMLYQGGQPKPVQYFKPRFEEDRSIRFPEARDRFRTLLSSAVAKRATPSAGCFLSGGTDSSTVAGMLGQVLGSPARTFSIGFDASGYDEMEFARIAARHFGTEHHEYYVTPEDLMEGVPLVAASYDQPFGNSSVLPAYYCARMAKASGVDKLLGGDGGDELFGGNSRYAKQRIFGAYGLLPAFARREVFEPLLLNAGARALPLVRKASSYVRQALIPMPDRLQEYNLIMRLGPAEVLQGSFLAAISIDAPARHQREVWDGIEARSLVNHMLAYDWRYTLGDTDLPKVVGSTALAGLPVAFPMLDDDLLEFSLTLPSDFKVRGMRLRWFFKEALRGFLPDEIITKKKQGFGLPFGPWLVAHRGLYLFADDAVRGLAARGILRADFADHLMKAKLHEHPGYYGEMVWISMMLEHWMRRHTPDFRVS